ncbi:MAG: carbon starvation protein A [Verrucomicrobia bacterium]|nr:MAG: carbon starvation protein A [Verrucomicrobiota bacterium]
MPIALRALVWLLVSAAGAFCYWILATRRGESVSSAYLVVAALCTYAVGYRFYSKWIAARVLALEDRRATPCEVREDGSDFVRTNPWIVFGHHFAAISGPGPLVGPVLAAQFGYLPGALWILIGVVLGGAVQDFVILFASMRRNGKSLGQMVKEEIHPLAGVIALSAILAIMVILLAVLGLIVVKALADSPWGVFTVGATIPIAMFMGGYLRFLRPGRTLEASVIGVALLLGAVWGGQYVHEHSEWARHFTFGAEALSWLLIGYGLLASTLPVWLLLAPRDYLSTFMKLGTIAALAAGVVLVMPNLRMPALVDGAIAGNGLVVGGKLFPFCFITIACGAISGFHSLVASGITPKIITRERYARRVGYGAMLLESMVAIMALVAACTLEPGVYLAMNVKGAGADAAAIAADTIAKVRSTGFELAPGTMESLAAEVHETTLYGRTGGAATLAVGMAQIFKQVVGGKGLGLWYHFAIMFEALFILTTLDAGTRVGRYLLQDFLGHVHPKLGDTRFLPANVLASALVVGGWGWFLVQGVRDPLGGINSLWPLFGIANQLLAAIALILGTTILLKTALRPTATEARRSPWIALVTLLPLAWLLTVTSVAGYQKMFDPNPKLGFLAAVRDYDAKLPALARTKDLAKGEADVAKAAKAVGANRALRFNSALDLVVTGTFLTLAAILLAMGMIEWFRILVGSRPPDLRESEAKWLPDTAANPLPGGSPLGAAAIAIALLRHWSGQDAVDRAAAHPADCAVGRVLIDVEEVRLDAARQRQAQAYVTATARRFDTSPPCC